VRSCVVVSTKKSSFLGSRRDVFRRPSAAPEPIAPKFLHTTFPSKYFVVAEFHHPGLSFGGVMAPTPSFASLQYGQPYSIWQAIKNVLSNSVGCRSLYNATFSFLLTCRSSSSKSAAVYKISSKSNDFSARRVCIARTMPWRDVCLSVSLSVCTPVLNLNGYTYP